MSNKTRTPWTCEELEFLKNNYQNYSYKELQKRFFPYRTVMSIKRKCITNGWLKTTEDNWNNLGWTSDKVEILKKYYPIMSTKEIQKKYLPEFTQEQITCFANSALNLKRNNRSRWTKEEDEIMKKYYSSMTNQELKENFFPNRTIASICNRAKKLGLKTSKELVVGWTEENLKILTKYFSNMSDEEISEKYLSQFTPQQIYIKGNSLGLKKNREEYQHWTDEETQILKDHFYDCTIEELREKYFCHRSRGSINKKANSLGLFKDVRHDRGWTDEYVDIIKNYYADSFIDDLQKKIPTKTKKQIDEFANILGVKKSDEQLYAIKLDNIKKSMMLSKPQQKINELLDSMNIKYEREYPVKYYLVDTYLPEYNLMIEIQGDYWHQSPLYNDILKPASYFIRTDARGKDKRKKEYIKSNFDIDVLYLWEYDINNYIEKCEALISLYINSKGILSNYHSFNYSMTNSQLQLIPKLYEIEY